MAHCIVEKEINAKGQEVIYSKDYATGLPLTITDSNGCLTQYEYDTLGRIINEYGPRDKVNPRVKYDYTNALTQNPKTQFVSVNRQIDIRLSNYSWSHVYLDGFGRVWREEKQAPGGIIFSDFQYHWQGFVEKEWLPHFSNESKKYTANSRNFDSLKRIILIAEPNQIGKTPSNQTLFTYDGLKTTITDANNHITYQYSDFCGRLKRLEQVNNDDTYVTTYEYDGLGHPILIKDANFNANLSSTPITITYDSLGRVIRRTDPYSGTTSYDYDLVGNMVSKTDAKDNVITYIYDEMNRITGKNATILSSGAQYPLARWVYDDPSVPFSKGRATQTFVGTSRKDQNFHYDADGNLITHQQWTRYGYPNTMYAEYDAQNRLKWYKGDSSDVPVIEYQYNCDVVQRIVCGNYTYATFSGWNASGMPGNVRYSNNVQTKYGYNPITLRMSSLETVDPSGRIIQSFGYSFDKVGNILDIKDNAPISTMHSKLTSQTFSYDYINRLSSSSVFGSYQYDRVGNIKQKEGVAFSYSDQTHPYCPTMGSSGYKANYDKNGNMIEKWDKNKAYWKYEYDVENMLVRVYKGTQKGSEVEVEEYEYNANGQRIRKASLSSPTGYIHYYLLGNLVTNSGNGWHILNGSEIIGFVKNPNDITYTHRDHLGSSSVVTDASGSVVNWNANRPYGENWQISPTITPDKDKFRFTGKETDWNSGLSYFGARYYDPEVGRFTTVDPAMDGMNWYEYCNNNPINFTDPTGLWVSNDDGTFTAESGDTLWGLQQETGTDWHFFNYQGDPRNLQIGQTVGITVNNNTSGITVDSNSAAVAHYYDGTGTSVNLGEKTIAALQNNPDQLAHQGRIVNGETSSLSGNYGVNLTGSMFHVGNTVVEYSTTYGTKYGVTTFTGFVRDGFWDVTPGRGDGLGPKCELPGGTPYAYNTYSWVIVYPNPY